VIGSLKGVVESVEDSVVLINVGGVGYEVTCTEECRSQIAIGGTHQIVVYTEVREDALMLFGFSSSFEKRVFLLLNSVSGIGPRSASDIVSQLGAAKVVGLISEKDSLSFQSAKGVGKKTAERIVVDLCDKVSALQVPFLHKSTPESEEFGTALDALQALGFSRREAQRALEQARERDSSFSGYASSEMIRGALQFV
jgi:holliday junction DNA helicase RuvA